MLNGFKLVTARCRRHRNAISPEGVSNQSSHQHEQQQQQRIPPRLIVILVLVIGLIMVRLAKGSPPKWNQFAVIFTCSVIIPYTFILHHNGMRALVIKFMKSFLTEKLISVKV